MSVIFLRAVERGHLGRMRAGTPAFPDSHRNAGIGVVGARQCLAPPRRGTPAFPGSHRNAAILAACGRGRPRSQAVIGMRPSWPHAGGDARVPRQSLERGHLGRMRAGTPALPGSHWSAAILAACGRGRPRSQAVIGTRALERGHLGRMRAGTLAFPGMIHYPAQKFDGHLR